VQLRAAARRAAEISRCIHRFQRRTNWDFYRSFAASPINSRACGGRIRGPEAVGHIAAGAFGILDYPASAIPTPADENTGALTNNFPELSCLFKFWRGFPAS
jgi:hypothetical protein